VATDYSMRDSGFKTILLFWYRCYSGNSWSVSLTLHLLRSWFCWHAVQKDCPSGELSRRKFLSIYSTLFPEGKAGPFYEHVFRTFDEDGSGRIDFKEFLQVKDFIFISLNLVW